MVELVSTMKSSKDINLDIKLAKKGDKDAFQNSIIKAYEGILYLKKNEYFKTWLIKILINECNAILRANKKVLPIEEVQSDTKVSDEFSKLELTNAVNSLPEDLKVVTTLFYFEDIPQKDIAKISNIPEGTVLSKLSRARNKLYEMLKEK